VTFTAQTKLGRILRVPEAAERLFAAMPELRDSPYMDVIRSLSLQDIALHLAAFDQLLTALAEIPEPQVDDTPDVYSDAYEVPDVARGSARCDAPQATPRWGVAEVVLDGPSHGNPFTEVEVRAVFHSSQRTFEVLGFYDGDGVYRIRVMPDAEGEWSFQTTSNARSLDGIEGSFTCIPPEADTHGPVRVIDTFGFAHADGTRYRPWGTTCYAWTHQGDDLEERTLVALAASPFTKVRMCVFPKAYVFNDNEPEVHGFQRSDDGTFDPTRFDPRFFRHLEARVEDIGRLGVEADLILFHPYDRWGYAELPPSGDDRYLRYVVARLGAHANVWWSLANEYDFMWSKDDSDWERFGNLVHDLDAHDHLIGVHNGLRIYDHARPWVTHCSLQKVDQFRTTENTTEWREQWQKPVVVDECAYEGDIDMTWGNISGEELTRRFWEGALRGGYVTHGETYAHPEDILWWAKGAALRGSSPKRIAFLRSIIEEAPVEVEPLADLTRWGYTTTGVRGEYVLQYLGFFQPRTRRFDLGEGETYRYEVIDTWAMTITDAGTHEGPHDVELPGRPYMAVRLTRVR
jgi:hypothetical protein